MARFLLPLGLLALLPACGDAAGPAAPPQRDPAVAAALALPLMTDPDLAGSSRSGTALAGGGPASGAIPLIKPDARAGDAARAAARQMLGAPFPQLPPPTLTEPASALAAAPTAAAVAAALPFSKACAAELDYSFAWAARLPAALPVYPHGQAQEAGGNDRPGCKLRVVNFQVPVSVDDVLAFYLGSARKAGLSSSYRRAGDDGVLTGGKGGLSFAVHARPLGGGLTEVELVTNGG